MQAQLGSGQFEIYVFEISFYLKSQCSYRLRFSLFGSFIKIYQQWPSVIYEVNVEIISESSVYVGRGNQLKPLLWSVQVSLSVGNSRLSIVMFQRESY